VKLNLLLLVYLAALVMISPATSTSTYVYVSNADSNDIHVLRLDDASGDLTPIETVVIHGITTPGISTPMALGPDRRFLYVATRGEPKIAAGFTIDPTSGKLTHVASGPLADSTAYIAIDRSGRFLLGASYPGHMLTVNPIEPPGTVQAPGQILPGYPNAHSILLDAANHHVLVPTLGDNRVNQFDFDANTGLLTPGTPPSVQLEGNTGPRHFAFSPDERFVFVLGEMDGAVHVLDYDARTGRLTEKQAVSALPPGFQGKPKAADIHITPDGRFLYASERTSSTLSGFNVDPDNGTLSSIGSWPTERQPRAFNIDPSGRFLLAAGQLSHSLSCYQIDATSGELVLLESYPMGKNPNWIEIVNLP
jgi:6-phosphogluconolactonase